MFVENDIARYKPDANITIDEQFFLHQGMVPVYWFGIKFGLAADKELDPYVGKEKHREEVSYLEKLWFWNGQSHSLGGEIYPLI